MDNQGNTGSFMSPAGGGGSAIAEAMSRRGFSGGVTNQVGAGSPTAQNAVPLAAPQPGNGMPPSAPMGQVPASPAPMPPTTSDVGMPAQGNPDKQLILNAFSQALKSMSKIEESQAGVQR